MKALSIGGTLPLLLLLLVVKSESFLLPSTLVARKDAIQHASNGVATFPKKEASCIRVSSSLSQQQQDEEESTVAVFTTEDLEFLQDALRNFQSSGSQQLLEKVRQLRRDGNNEASVEFLNSLLSEGPDRQLPRWLPLLLPRFSKRARLASLRRTLELTTPPPEEDGTEFTEEDLLRRRRRALVSLLQSLASEEGVSGGRPAIMILEQKARQEQRGSNSKNNNRNDMWNRRPTDLETPNYTVVASRPRYEIRSYEPFSVCSVAMNQARPADSYKTDAVISDPKMAGARAFGALAGYLFGKNQQASAMKMTTPVLTTNIEKEKLMSFVLPSEYWDDGLLQTAPQPLEGSGVTLQQQAAANRAVAMFGGYASKSQVDKQKKALMEALADDDAWEAITTDEVALAQYNDPFTPPWKRLNEVSIQVVEKQQQ